MVSIVATSDLHGQLPKIPPADLLLIAGDICPNSSTTDQANWLDQTFRVWLDELPVQHVVGVAGNHDRLFEINSEIIPKDLRWHYLQDESITLFDLKIYGTPWQLPFWGAFNLSDKMLVERYHAIEPYTDIVISHGPPFGILDEVPSYLDTSHHTGSLALRNRILYVKPQLVVFGHIHEKHGTYFLDQTLCANVSLLNDEMHPVYSPALFHINPRTPVSHNH
jgi:Icc-related predicted phosphoesterase